MSRAKNAFNQAPSSWGPPPLTARPEGLLDSLGIQSGGEYPVTLLRDLHPTYELGAWYREYNQTFATATATIVGDWDTGETIDTGLQVPEGQIWIVNRIGCSIAMNALGAGSQLAFQLLRTNSVNTTILAVSAPQLVQATTNPSALVLGLDYPPLLLRPTVKLRVLFCGTSSAAASPRTALNTTVTTSVAYQACRI